MARLDDGGDGAGFVRMLLSHGEMTVPKPAPTNLVPSIRSDGSSLPQPPDRDSREFFFATVTDTGI